MTHHEQRRRFALLDEMHRCDEPDLDAVWQQLRILTDVIHDHNEGGPLPQDFRTQRPVRLQE